MSNQSVIETAFQASLSFASTAATKNLSAFLEGCIRSSSNYSEWNGTSHNFTNLDEVGCLEHAPKLSKSGLIRAIVLSCMAIVSLIGNVATMWNIKKNRANRQLLYRHNCSAIYALIFHLSVSDVLVTFFCIIGEAAWSYTVEWYGGDIVCKLVKISQMFSLYLSTNVLVLIGIDRWVAVKFPMKSKILNTARFLFLVYLISLLLSLPQVIQTN